jgi:hypothetical protein
MDGKVSQVELLLHQVGTLRQENRILQDEVRILQEILNKTLAYSASRRDL